MCIRDRIRHVEMDQRRFQQIVDLGFFMDKRLSLIHIYSSMSRPLMVMEPVPLGNRWTRATEDLRLSLIHI